MIADADQTLANVLIEALNGSAAVSFETPSESWIAEAKRPVVSCFLHRVVEDLNRRGADVVDVRNAEGRVDGRQPPVRHYRLDYQISVWAKSAEQEHDLLGAVLMGCAQQSLIGDEHRAGVLEGEPEPVLLEVGIPTTEAGPAAHQIWASLGVPAGASLSLTMIVPLRLPLDTDIAASAEHFVADFESLDRPVVVSSPSSVEGRNWTTFRIREKTPTRDEGGES